MSRLLLARRRTWLAVAVIGGCMLLGGCAAGAPGTASAGSARPSSASASAPTPGSSASASSPAAVAASGLTGSFCADFANLKDHVPTIPPGDKGNLPALQRDATHLLAAASSYFNALAGESPTRVATALRTIASAYQQDETVAQSQTSAASLEHLIQTAQYTGPALAALGVVGRYYAASCH